MKNDTHFAGFVLKQSQRLWEKFDRQRRRVADMQFSLLSAAHSFCCLHGLGHALQHRASFGQKYAPRLRESDCLGVVLEERQLKLLFEVEDLPTQAGL